MGLIPFDNKWYCDKCNEVYQGIGEIRDGYDGYDYYNFCPKCGNALKNDWYQGTLESINNTLKRNLKSVCVNCGKEFDGSYKFCPFCAEELKKENVVYIDRKNNSLIGNWNGEEFVVLNKNIFLTNPHFIGTKIIYCFENKKELDEKLEEYFFEIGEEEYDKLTYDEVFHIAGRVANGFNRGRVLEFVEDGEEEDYYGYIKIREDLFCIIIITERVDY